MTYSELVESIRQLITTLDYRRKKLEVVRTLDASNQNSETIIITPQDINAYERDPGNLTIDMVKHPEKLVAFARLLSAVFPLAIDAGWLDSISKENTIELPFVQEYSLVVTPCGTGKFAAVTSIKEVMRLIQERGLIGDTAYCKGERSCGLVSASAYLNDSDSVYAWTIQRILSGQYVFEPIHAVLLTDYDELRYHPETQTASWSDPLLGINIPLIQALQCICNTLDAFHRKEIEKTPCVMIIDACTQEEYRALLLQSLQSDDNRTFRYLVEHHTASTILQFMKDPTRHLRKEMADSISLNDAPYPSISLIHAFERAYVPSSHEDVELYGEWLITFFNAFVALYEKEFNDISKASETSILFHKQGIVLLVILSRIVYDDIHHKEYQNWLNVLRRFLDMDFSENNASFKHLGTSRDVLYDMLYAFVQQRRREVLGW